MLFLDLKKMKILGSISLVFSIAIIDLIACILCFILLTTQRKINDEIFSFSYGTSTFDLIICSCLRFCIMIGISFGLLRNIAVVKRLKNSTNIAVYYGCAQAIYVVLKIMFFTEYSMNNICLLYTSPSPRDKRQSRMPSSA